MARTQSCNLQGHGDGRGVGHACRADQAQEEVSEGTKGDKTKVTPNLR